jgi:hypothetical protein
MSPSFKSSKPSTHDFVTTTNPMPAAMPDCGVWWLVVGVKDVGVDFGLWALGFGVSCLGFRFRF